MLPGFQRFNWREYQDVKTLCGWNPRLYYNLVQTEAQLASMRETLIRNSVISWDTETSGMKPELGARVIGHAFACRTGDREIAGWYVPIRHIGPHNDEVKQLSAEIVSPVVAEILSSEGEVCTHHGKFDRKLARPDGIEVVRSVHDVAIDATIFDENEPRFSLKHLAVKHCSPMARDEEAILKKWMQGDAKSLKMSFKKHSKKKRELLGELNAMTTPTYLERFGYSRTPIHLCGHYGIHDVFYNLYLRSVTYRRVPEVYPLLWAREHKIADYLLEMEWNGLRADEALIRATHEETLAGVRYWFDEVRRLRPSLPESFTGTDNELRKLYYDDLGMTPPKHTKKGQKPAVDKEARKILAKKYPEHKGLLRALGKLAEVEKLHSTYAGSFLRFYSPITKTINPSYNQLEARDTDGGVPVTGRLSSSDPNAQNVAKTPLHLWDCGCKKCVEEAVKEGYHRDLGPEHSVFIHRYFVIDPGWVRLFVDFSQIELRILAWFCQDPTMIHAYQNDIDLHKLLSDELGIIRDVAKRVWFGNNYGQQHIGLARHLPDYYDDVDAAREKAQKILDAFHARYQGVNRFRRTLAEHMRRNKCMFVNPFGRPRRIPDINAQERWRRERAERMMMASIVSGTAADLMKESMIRTGPIVHAVGGKVEQTVHDEIMFGIPMNPGWANTVIKVVRTMEDWPMFSQDSADRKGVPIKVSAALSTTSWAGKKKIEVLPDDTFRLAA